VYMLNGKKPIRITRIHVEEDPGKTKRVGDLSSLVDYNRSGIPLAEIVTEPDLSTPAEAREFLGQLIADIRHVIDLPGDGERSIRCDCNISVGKERCEVKNVTGLKNVERALTFEYIRQSKILKAGGKIERETRRFDEERGVTISVRKKEFEADYGYIDEPDLGIYHIKAMADAIKIRESPQQMAARMVNEYGIDQKMAKQLIATSVSVAELFERVAKETDVQNAVKWVAGPVSAHWKSLEEGDDASDDIVAVVKRFATGEITDAECGMQIKCRLTGEDAEAAAAGSADLEALIEQAIAENPSVVADYAKNDKAINKVIGSVMRQSGGKYSSSEVVEAAKRILESKMQRTSRISGRTRRNTLGTGFFPTSTSRSNSSTPSASACSASSSSNPAGQNSARRTLRSPLRASAFSVSLLRAPNPMGDPEYLHSPKRVMRSFPLRSIAMTSTSVSVSV